MNDDRRPRPQRVALGLGSNLGDRADYLARAAACIGAEVLTDMRVSRFHETAPVDCPPGTPAFLNAAVTGVCRLPPTALLAACQDLERRLGRLPRHGYHADRTIDVDLLLYGRRTIDLPQLKIPHPLMTRRTFVLVPLAEIAPDWPVPPGRRTVAAWLQAQGHGSATGSVPV